MSNFNKNEKMTEEKLEKKVRIDPGVPWNEPHNIEAAIKLGVNYDRIFKVYRDLDGCPVLDRYGQPLG